MLFDITETPGCGATPFIEIQEDPELDDYSYESAKLGIVAGELPAVPALSTTGLLGLAGALLATAGLARRRRARV